MKQLHANSLPVWLGIGLCFVLPIYAQIHWGGPPDDVHLITFVLGTVVLGAWLGMPQIIAVLFMCRNELLPGRWVLLVMSGLAAFYVADIIDFPFPTASSMATAHVFAPLYGAAGVVAGGVTVLVVQWLISRTK